MKSWRKEEDTYQACPLSQKVEEDGTAEGELALTDPKEEIIAVEEEGETITINTLAEQVKKSMESNSNISHLDPRDGDIRDSSCNPNGAKGGIGFVSAVSQGVGLEKTSNWFRSEN